MRLLAILKWCGRQHEWARMAGSGGGASNAGEPRACAEWDLNAETQRGGRRGSGVVCGGPGDCTAWKATAQRKGAKTPGRNGRPFGGMAALALKMASGEPGRGTASRKSTRMVANRGAWRRGVTRDDMRGRRGLEGRGSPQRHRGHGERQGTNRPCFVEQISRAKTLRRKGRGSEGEASSEGGGRSGVPPRCHEGRAHRRGRRGRREGG